ncbi:transposase [Sessilibacter corallicola]|uniref:Transposase n=1 Tax=Sessilibacter corallicola TaxID=2904075 RepID=A0ABQ0ABL9_9GAMM
MFMPNDVYSMDSKRLRVLWANRSVVIWIDIDYDRAFPKISERIEFEELLAKRILQKIDDPYISVAMTFPDKNSKAEKVQERAWVAIKDFVAMEPEIYPKKTRGPLFQAVQERAGTTKQTVYRWFRRYWQLGKCKNALNGQFDRCGGLGKPNTPREKKLGAPRTITPGKGVNIDDSTRNIFRVAIEKCLLTEDKYDFDYAYNQVLIAFGVPIPCKAEDLKEVPTKRQLRYFYEKEYSPILVTRKREGEINYFKDFRPVLGTSTTEVSGPGTRYQIDATIADVYLVSERDRNKIIGRPTLYFVVDVFSRAIVGMYIGLENASWVSAMEALINTIEDKVEFCKKFDIDITEAMWPTIGLPEVLIGDRGEMLGRHVDVLCKAFNVEIENTPPYRADWKGIVERYFRTVQTKMKPFVEGYVTKVPIGKKRHGKDYRQDGIHTLYEFTQMIINIVLYYNNEHIISTYDPDPELPEDIPYNALTLWEWGIEWRTGRLRRPKKELVRVNLLPHTTATITEFGIKLFGCYYTCKLAVNKGWFERNYQGPRNITVAYDYYSANVIFIRLNDDYSDYLEADLTERSRAYRDMTIWEVWSRNKVRALINSENSLKKRAGSINLAKKLEEIARKADHENSDTSKSSKASRVKDIRDNKNNEKEYERHKNKSVTEEVENDSDNVIPINKQPSQRVSFKLPPRLKDLLTEGENNHDEK